MKAAPFDYVAPASVAEAAAALSATEDAKVLAGGQSLVPMLAFRLAQPALLIDLNRIPALSYVRQTDDGLAVGAMTRTRELETSRLVAEGWPLAREAAPFIGHRQIRNRGTVGGSVAHADPAGELPAVVLATDATLLACGPSGERTIRAADFFRSVFATALRADEVLTEIRIPTPPAAYGTAFVEVGMRHGDFALAGAAATVSLEAGACIEAHLVLVGVGATPVEVPASELLRGAPVTADTTREVVEALDPLIAPGSDMHATAAYRRQLVRALAQRALLLASERARSRDAVR